MAFGLLDNQHQFILCGASLNKSMAFGFKDNISQWILCGLSLNKSMAFGFKDKHIPMDFMWIVS